MLLNTNNLDLLKTLPMDRAISEATAWMENELDLSKMETAKKIIDILNTRFNSNRDSDDSIFTLDHAKDSMLGSMSVQSIECSTVLIRIII